MNGRVGVVATLALVACSGGDIGQGGDGGADPTSSSTGGSPEQGGAGGATMTGGGGAPTGAGGLGGAGGASGGGGAGGLSWQEVIDPNAGPSSTRLTSHPLGTTGAAQGYHAYLPGGYPGGAKWPLLVALHGVGENGDGTTQLDDVLVTGIPKVINQDMWPGERPFVVLMPQHSGGGCPGAQEIHDFIGFGMSQYDIDPRWVYLTGLSCGAIGSWTYLAQHLDSQIAAMVPIAGNGTNAWNAVGCDLGKVAIWAFHGDADPTVDVSGTNTPMDGLASCPSPPALENDKTIYPGIGHNSWQMTYDLSAGHDIYDWMLGFEKTLP